MPYIPPENELDYIIDEDENEEELELLDDDDNENEADYTSYDYDGPNDIGVPDPNTSGGTPASEEEEETKYIVTYKDRALITSAEPAYLYELFQNGATFYAIYDDDTEEEVSWDEIEDLNPLDTLVDLGEAIASATNQHFWNDDNGVHVAEINKESWQTATESNFSDLSSSKNYYNLLTNSLGLLFRRALYNLVSITRTSISFYDGTGNQSSNVMAYFGRDSAQIGRSNSKHLSLDSEGITAYNADGTVAPLQAANISAAEANITQLQANTADIATIRANSAKVASLTADALTAATAYIAALNTLNVTANDISANKATINSLVAGDVTADTIRAASAYIAALTSASVTANDISANKATLGALIAGNVTTDTLRAASAYISALTTSNISASTITADHANVTTIIADYLTSADIQAEQIRVGQLLAGYVETDFSNADVAWIENGTIKDGAITNAMINSVSANKLTAGTIDASNITVTNLNADNITTGTINGQRIGEGSLSLSKLEDDVYTESEVDSMLSAMQAEIDGAIETWTGTAVPTLNNTPASGWTTNAIKDTHVGDVYFVVNSQSQQNGYNYRFTKSGSGSSATYSWQLIKDNDVTNALQRLTTAEGKITTFDSDISQLKTDTGSLTTRTTTLETRADGIDSTLLDKVDVTDFNSLEDTVDGHTQTLSQHTTAISNKADSSTVTAVTNRVSQNEQNISGITTRVGSLETTVATKADSSTVTTVSNNLSTLSQTVDSFQTTVSSTYATKESVNKDYSKTQSRGEQLITNGNGMMGDNTNFSALIFDGSKSNGSPGSFTKSTGTSAEISVDEYFPVDPSKEYEASFDVLSSGDGANSRMYGQLYMYDVDKKLITVQCVSYYPSTTTTLAQDLKNGDTTVHLTDASNWHGTSAAHQRSLIFWNYTNNAGYLYPIGTYSRNYYSGVYEDDSSVDKQAGTITLLSPWSRGTIAAGTPVSQNTSGGSYAYFWIDSNGSKILVDEWLHVSGLYSGTKGPQGVNSPVPPSDSFWHGTAYCKIGWLWNYQSSVTGTQRRLWITNVSMKIKNASVADVNAAVEAIPRMAKINMASRNFTLSQWNNYGAVGHVENWSTGSTYDNSHLRVGDRAYLIGTISDKNAGSATIIGEVTNVVPTGVGTSYITLKTEQLIFGGDVVTAVESRVSTAESTIVQHTNSIALKANSADVYTKTQSDGLISTEVTNRNAAIQVATEGITSMVSETYTSKEELSNALDSRVHDNDSWLYRQVPDDVQDGIATIESISGNTVVWNQMVDSMVTRDGYEGINTSYDSTTGLFSLTNVSRTSNYNTGSIRYKISDAVPLGHKFLIRTDGPTGITASYNNYVANLAANTVITSEHGDQVLCLRVTNRFDFATSCPVGSTITFHLQIFDLTRMFGEGNEPSTVAEFEALFPEPYYPYDAGSLLSVQMEGIETVGFNQWDEQWEVGGINTTTGAKITASNCIRSKNYIPVFPETEYRFTSNGTLYVFYYDGALNFLSWNSINNIVKTLPANCHYILFQCVPSYGTTYQNDICINISNPALNGTHKPYVTYQRTIPASTYFPNGMRSAGDVHDELTSNAAITRVGAVDLGTLTWAKYEGGTEPIFTTTPPDFFVSARDVTTIQCSKYDVLPAMTYQTFSAAGVDKAIATVTNIGAANRLGVHDITYTDAATFKAAMSGVMLYYAIATPTTTPIDLPLTYRVEQGGTECVTHTDLTAAPTIDIQYGLSTMDSISDALLRVDSAESSIIQNATDISLKVSKNDVINQINVSTEGATINANRVNITGEAVFSAINNDTGTTKINGGKIDATAITIGQSQVTGLATALNGKADDSDVSAIQDDLNSSRVWYAVCDTVAATVSKVATISPATTDFTLEIGRMVNVRFVNTNTGAVASLTLNINGTGAKPIKNFYNGGVSNLSSAGYLKADSIITFKYDGTNWVTDLTVNSTYNQGVSQLYNTIKAKTSIIKESIIVGDANGYSMAAAGVSFDLSYPILWTTVNINANGTNYASVYTSYHDRNLATNHGFSSGTPNSIVYLVGTVTGNTFTLASSYITTIVPNSEDGYCYIAIGRLGNQSTGGNYFYFFCVDKPTLYTYKDGLFGPASIREASAAAKTATNYISLDSTGIRIANENPATATTYQHQTFNKTEFVSNNTSVAEFGATTRIGRASHGNVLLSEDGFDYNQGDTSIFSVSPSGSEAYDIAESYSSVVTIAANDTGQVSGQYYRNSVLETPEPYYQIGSSHWLKVGEDSSDSVRVLEASSNVSIDGLVSFTFDVYNGLSQAINVQVANVYDVRAANVRIGKTNESHMQLDYHSIRMIDKEGSSYFHISDLRDTNGLAEVSDCFVGNGATKKFTLNFLAYDTNYSVALNGTEVASSEITKSRIDVEFASAPVTNAEIIITYSTESADAKAYTVGVRAEGKTIGPMSFAEGYKVEASGAYSHAEGLITKAKGLVGCHAEGISTTASGHYGAHAEGEGTYATGSYSHAEGHSSRATSVATHAEGTSSVASATEAHAEGNETTASGWCGSHSEGNETTASGNYGSHAEGNETTASGNYGSHAEGQYTIASGRSAHAEGNNARAVGNYSHAQNTWTIAGSDNQTVIGVYNSNDSNNAFEIGNGNANTRSNALTVDWSGNVDISGVFQAHNGREIFGGTSSSVLLQHKDANNAEDFRIQFYIDSNGHPALRGSLNGGSSWEYPYPNQYASHTANTVWAAPNGSNGVAGFRALVAADIPNLNASKITAGNLDIPGSVTSDGAITSGAAIYAHDGQEIFGGTDALVRIYHRDASNQEDFRFDFYIDGNGNPAMRASLDAGSSWKYPYLNQLSSRTANTVLAGPNGSNGAPSFRALVANDIPNLNASKITAGTLGTARGGTGVSGRQSSTITVDTSNVTVGDANHCWHNGVVCSFSYNFKTKASLANNGTLTVGTLPSGYRPPYTFVGSAYTSTASAQVDVSISTGGVITVRNVSGAAIATSVTIRVGATFAL